MPMQSESEEGNNNCFSNNISDSRRTKPAGSIRYNLPFLLPSIITEICKFLLPYDFHHNILCSLYKIIQTSRLLNKDNSSFFF